MSKKTMNFDISNLILHKSSFLTDEECKILKKYFEKNKKKGVKEKCPEATTGIETWSSFNVIDVPCGIKEYKIIHSAIEKVINLYHEHTDKFDMFHVCRKDKLLYSHKIRLMKYDTGAKIHAHVDHENYEYGSCTFNLNDDYEGGEFCFFKNKIKYNLKKGDVLIFPASPYWVHEVKPITKGVRYSVNTFLLSVPESINREVADYRNSLLKNYKFSIKDGLTYKIKET
tara:strand:- start:31 stop:714 length:684 start_codon:yes stop_codon:yes gene_type:complete